MKANATKRRVFESLGNRADDLKTKRLPKSHSGVVRFHNSVELHIGVPLPMRSGQRVLAERASDSPASRIAAFVLDDRISMP